MIVSRPAHKRPTHAQRLDGPHFLVSGLTWKLAIAFEEAARSLGLPDASFGAETEVRIDIVQAKRIAMYAEILEVRPQDFLNWILGDYIKDLQSSSGILQSWADELVAYESDEIRERVQARVTKYQDKRRQAESNSKAKDSKKGGKPS